VFDRAVCGSVVHEDRLEAAVDLLREQVLETVVEVAQPVPVQDDDAGGRCPYRFSPRT
jgi:hypothetical protein